MVELLVGVAIIIIMLVAGIPLYETVQGRSQLASQTNNIVKALKLARAEAVSRGRTANACPRGSNDTSCASGIDTGCDTDWLGGIIVYIDNLSAGDLDVASASQLNDVDGDGSTDDLITRVFPAVTGAVGDVCSKNARANIQFEFDGSTDDDELLVLKHNEVNRIRCLEVNSAGQINLEKVTVSSVSSVSDTSDCSESTAVVVLP